MTDPLKELRSTTKTIQQKQEESLKQTHQQRLEQQELLAKNSIEHQQGVKGDAKKAADKSQRMKIAILSIVIVGLCAFLGFSIYIVTSASGSVATRKTVLASSGRTELFANDKDYLPVRKFALKILADFGKDGAKSVDCWYSSLTTVRKARCLAVMKKLKLDSSWKVKKIEKDSKGERFFVFCANGKEASVTLDVIYDDEMELKLVKVY